MAKKKPDSEKKGPDDIRVTFQDTDFEKQLYHDIIEESKIVGPVRWMKVAAHEKLQRDKMNLHNAVNQSSINPTVKALDQMFKK